MINNRNRILAIFFIAFFAVNIILPSNVLVHFKVNQDYISENLCVEKDIQESTCDGHCQLKKSLDIIEKGSSEEEDIKFNVESHIIFLFAQVSNRYEHTFVSEKESFSTLESKNPITGFYDIPFLPPILL